MIRLNLPTAPYWLALPLGVSALVRPLTTAIWEQAGARATRLARELGEHAGAVEAAGGQVSGLPDLADPDAQAGLQRMLHIQALGQVAILEWRGVGDDDWAELAVSDEAVAAMMAGFPVIANGFLAKYTEPHAGAIAEGKGLGTSPDGTGGEVPIIAEGAGTTTSPAAGARP